MQFLLNRVYTVLNCALVTGVLLKNHHAARLSAWQHRWIDRAVLAVLVALVAGTAWLCASNVVHPRAWDFPCFYTVARAAASGQPFYQPAVLRRTFLAANLDGSIPDDWFNELYYLYLPPSALLLAPLGLLDYRHSLALHYAIQAAFLVAAVLLLHRLAPLRRGWRGAVEIMVLALAFRPVEAAFDVAQIVFGALFFTVLALTMVPRQPVLAGLALAVGALYKHLLIIVALLSTLLRRLSTGLAFAVGLGALVIASLVAFGSLSYSDFSLYGPSVRPAAEYVETTNQSLLAELYRLSGHGPQGAGLLGAILFPPFLGIGGLLALVTASLCRFGRRMEPPALYLRVALLVSVALLVYPNTLYNTLPLILPGLVLAFSFRDRLPVPASAVVGFIAVVYACASYPEGGGFAAVMVSWLGLATLLVAMEVYPQT